MQDSERERRLDAQPQDRISCSSCPVASGPDIHFPLVDAYGFEVPDTSLRKFLLVRTMVDLEADTPGSVQVTMIWLTRPCPCLWLVPVLCLDLMVHPLFGCFLFLDTVVALSRETRSGQLSTPLA